MTTHTAGSDRELVLTRLIDAPREKLFRAWTEPEVLRQWFTPAPYPRPFCGWALARTDSAPEGSGFEPSVPLPRLSSIQTVGAEIIGEYGCLSARPRVRCLCPPGKTQHLLPKSVFDRPGSDRWNLASTTFPDAGPRVRILFPPAQSLRTTGSSARARRSRAPALTSDCRAAA